MLLLQMLRGMIQAEKVQAFGTLVASVPKTFRPLIGPARVCQEAILGFSIEPARPRPIQRRFGRYANLQPGLGQAEVFTDGTSLFAFILQSPRSRETESETSLELRLIYIGQEKNPAGLQNLKTLANEVFGVSLQRFSFSSGRLNDLKAEGRISPTAPSKEQLAGAHVLQDRAARTLAIAIKSSGGLLVRDLAKQLPQDVRDRTDELQKTLQGAGLIDAEIVIVCSKTQAQTGRVPSRAVLEELSKKGLKCACGRPIINERIEEALAVTDLGRDLLDGSRWFTLQVLHELENIGIPLDRTLIDQQAGGDELDLIVDISGELVFFELKDKEFNLGNAYSFGAKIGIVRPEFPVIVTTEYVGKDAKEHFQRAKLAGGDSSYEIIDTDADEYSAQGHAIRYIEGIDNLRQDLMALTSEIYIGDAARILGSVLPMVSLDSHSLLRAMEERLTGDINTAQGPKPSTIHTPRRSKRTSRPSVAG